MLKSFKLKATIEVKDEYNFGEDATFTDAAAELEKDLLQLAADSDRGFVVTSVEPIEDKDFIA